MVECVVVVVYVEDVWLFVGYVDYFGMIVFVVGY